MHNELSITSRVCVCVCSRAIWQPQWLETFWPRMQDKQLGGLKGETGCYRQGPLWLKGGRVWEQWCQ